MSHTTAMVEIPPFYTILFLLAATFVYTALSNLARTKPVQVKPPATPAVIAMAVGYGPPAFRNFVGTLRSTGYRGLIILGINKVPGDLGRNVRLEMISSGSNQELFRYQWYRDMLTNVTHALLTDFRDVYFQDNPFRVLPRGLQLFGEHHSTNIGLSNHNTWWIEKCWGRLYTLGDHWFNVTSYCSGTICGEREALLPFLAQMVDTIRWMQRERCTFKGSDQGALNYLVYSNALPYATLVPYRTGLVNTVGAEGSIIRDRHTDGNVRRPFSTIPGQWLDPTYGLTDKHGRFTNLDGSISPVVHQYDRYGRRFPLAQQIGIYMYQPRSLSLSSPPESGSSDGPSSPPPPPPYGTKPAA